MSRRAAAKRGEPGRYLADRSDDGFTRRLRWTADPRHARPDGQDDLAWSTAPSSSRPVLAFHTRATTGRDKLYEVDTC